MVSNVYLRNPVNHLRKAVDYDANLLDVGAVSLASCSKNLENWRLHGNILHAIMQYKLSSCV